MTKQAGKTAVQQAVSGAPQQVARVQFVTPNAVRAARYARQNAMPGLTGPQVRRLRKKAAREARIPDEARVSVVPDGGLPNLVDAVRFPQSRPGWIGLPPC